MQTFQKKLVVVEFTGDDQPCKFTLKEYMVLARGMLPEIGLEESEEEIRKKIAETLRNSDDTHDVTLTLTLNTLACLSSHTDDFEFLEASGKTMCVPARSKELEWTGGGCVSIFD